ncbi:MAG TPA: CHAT domain-containing tetratricopeptide repeat protein [Pyrinomonadaceae bacterium]|jgi:CHAT domain-containing protein|nr:CHAT domain-containing tetratricopeptide repeat protein [Pyrinomonadaceae bacterium]
MKFKASPLAYLLSCAVVVTSLNVGALRAQVSQARGPMAAAAIMPQADQARAALEQGRKLLKRGQADQALGQLEQALKLYQQANDAKGTAAASDALGDLYSRQGQYEVALKHYQEARTAYASVPDNYNANLMLAKTGDMYYRSGNVNEARSAYSQMSVTKPDTNAAKDVQQKASKGRSLFGRAQSIASGGPSLSTASNAAAVGADVANTIKEEREKYRQFILYAIYETGIGRADFLTGQLDSAKTHFDNALAAADSPIYGKFGQSRRWRVAARTSLGDVALGQSRFADAIKLFTAAADGARKDNRPDLMWPAQRGMARSRWGQAAQEKDAKKAAQGREGAIAAYRDALKTIEAIRSGSLGADESRSTFLATTKDVYDEAASALAERALVTAAGASGPLTGAALTDAAEAFQIVEQSRARSLLDMLGEAGANITEGVPADLLKRKQDNLDRQQEIAEILTGASLNPDADKKSNSDLEAELNQLATDYDSIENQIRAASPRYAALTLPQPLTLAEVQQQVLDDKTALLEYSLGNQSSYLWAVTQGGVSLYKLPARSAVDQQAIELRNQLVPTRLRTRIAGIDVAGNQTRGLGVAAAAPDNSAAAAFATASNALYKTVVEPAAKDVGDKRMLIVADGALNYVPFEALVSASGGGDYASLPYLVKTNEIVYAPSASVVSVIRKQMAKPTGKNILLVADPVFNSNDPRAKGAAAPTAAGGDTRGLGLASALTDVAGTPANQTPATGLQLARLTGTRTEAEEIAKLTRASGGQADIWLDLQASEANVQTKDLKNYRVLHVATHGLLDAERPQFTGLVLSLVGNKTGDGFLRTDEIFNLKLGAPLVMLSACETGLGKEKRGEGVIGLTRAFMYAGAPTVGVTMWSVADRSTADLMTDLYKRMLTGPGMSAVAAKQAAQQSMIAGKKYSAPFYWAPFVLVGEWR